MKVFTNVLLRILMEQWKPKRKFPFAVCIDASWILPSSSPSFSAKPKVEGKVNDVAVQINEPAELRTKFSAIPKPTIAWFVSSGLFEV